MSVRLFNSKTKLWSIYWADSYEGKLDPPVLGSFENNIGHFITSDIFNGKNILVAFRWDARERAILFGARPFQTTMERHGNGISICI